MTRNRDIAKFLGKTETSNTTNARLLTSAETVGLDSAQVTSIAEGQGLAAYTSIDSLPTTGLTAGDQAFVESSQRLYISTGTGWYNVALLNATPTLTLDQSGTIQLNADTLTVTVTASATDSDDNPDIITFSVESDGNMVGTGVTVSQDSSVFTITSLSQDSGGTAGDFTLTFKATDQINVDNESLDFSLSFSNVVDSSSVTTLLMKAAGNSATNAAITYQNSSDVSTGFTEAGTPQASTFTPYRSGGYSTQFADGGAGNLSWSGTTLDSDYTIEAWIYTTEVDNSGYNNIISDQSSNVQLTLHNGGNGNMYTVYQSAVKLGPTASGTGLNEWAHFVWEREGTTLRHYVNGALLTSGTADNNSFSISKIGQYYTGGYEHHGYIRDLRVLKTAKYGGSSYTVPTSTPAYSDDATTQFIACHLPYIKAEGVSISRTGATFTSTTPFGPYDYEPWTANDHGGSVYFDGTGDRLELASLDDLSGGSWTIEGWYRFETDPNSATHLLWSLNDEGTTGYAQLQTVSGTTTLRLQQRGGSYLSDGTYDFAIGIWYHIASVWDGTNMKVYVNGTQALSSTTNVIQNAGNGLTINGDGGGSLQFEGHIADFRISTDARYTANFTPPTAPLSHNGSATKLLMNNKSDANIYDAAAANKLILAGDTQSATAQRKFTTSSSVSFDGTGDYAYQENSELFALGTGDFTVEAWIYYTTFSGSGGQAIVSTGTSTSSATSGHWYLTAYGASDLRFGRHGSAQYTSGASSLSTNTWHHLAVAREGTTVRIFVDGTALTTSDTGGGVGSYDFNNSSGYLFVGEGASFSPANGYMQDLRITKGKARYTSNFTPPTAEFEL